MDFGSGCRFCMVAKIYDRSAFARNSKVIVTNTTYVARNGVLVRTPSLSQNLEFEHRGGTSIEIRMRGW